MSKKKILLTDAEGNTLYPQAVTTNVVDAEGNKVNLDGIWTQDNLKGSDHVLISQIQKPVIDGNTVALFSFDEPLANYSTTDKIHGFTLNSILIGITSSYHKFGASCLDSGRTGSGYFPAAAFSTAGDGTTLASQLTGDFTIDFWFLHLTNTKCMQGVHLGSNSSFSTMYAFTIDGNSFTLTSPEETKSITIDKSSWSNYSWHHIAVIRNSVAKELCFYLDGVNKLSVASENWVSMSYFAISGAPRYDSGEKGYFDELRLSNSVRWYGKFTPYDSPYIEDGGPAEYEIKSFNLATTTELATKQDVIADLADIRSGAALGATSVQQSDLANVWTKTNLKQGNHIAITQVDKPVIDSDTVTLYHFDNDCIDTISGKDCLDATDSSTVSYLDREKFGKVIYSGLETTYNTNIWLKNDTGLVPAETSFTIDFWINPDNFSKSRGINFIKYSSPSAWISIQSNGIYIGQVLYAAGSDHLFLYDTSSMLSTWSHIAFVHDLNTTKNYLFINGVLLESWTYTVSSTSSLFNELKISGMCKVDELRISNVARWTADFTPYTEPYAPSDAPAEYTINSTLKAGQNITIDADGYISAAGGGSSAPTRFYFKNFEADESTEEFPNEVDTNMDLTDKFIRVYKNGVYQMQDDESTESGAETVDYYIEGTKVVFHSAFTAETKIIVEVF